MNQRHEPSDEEARIRDLLNDAVEHVEPREGVDSILERTRVVPLHRRPWVLGTLAAVTTAAAAVTAFAVTGGDTGTRADSPPQFATSPSSAGPSPSAADVSPDPSPTDRATKHSDQQSGKKSPDAASPTKGAAVATRPGTVPVYYVGDTSAGPLLYREFHDTTLRGPDPGWDEALDAALSAPPRDPDYHSLWPSGSSVSGVHFDRSGKNGLFRVALANPDVDLRSRPQAMSDAEARAAVQQLVYTVQATAQTRAPVRFALGTGKSSTPVRRLLGVDLPEQVRAGDSVDVLAQVWILELPDGATVSSPFSVKGLADHVFEGNVQWELKQSSSVVKSGFTTVSGDAFSRAPYSFRVSAPPGTYTLVVHGSDPSGGAEGHGPPQDTKRLTVR